MAQRDFGFSKHTVVEHRQSKGAPPAVIPRPFPELAVDSAKQWIDTRPRYRAPADPCH